MSLEKNEGEKHNLEQVIHPWKLWQSSDTWEQI